MVRLNKHSDFQFPFLAKNSSVSIQASKSNQLDFADKVLSIFAVSFFFTILIAITLDNMNPDNYVSANSIAKLKPQVENIMALANLDKEEIQIKPKEKPEILKNKTLALAPPKIKPKPKSTFPREVKTATSIPVQPKSKLVSSVENERISNPIEIPFKVKIQINQPKNQVAVKYATAKTSKVSPKPVFVNTKVETQDLVLNEKITQDLLPLSYFQAKEKAAQEGKLMYIKFGAKWCLPCRQMEKTTFKDERVIDFSEKNYVSLSVDVEDFDGVNMKAYFNVQFLPTLLIFNSQGNFVAKYVNYQSAASMLEILEKHKYEHQAIATINPTEVKPSPQIEAPKVAKIASISFDKIVLSKKIDGNAINSLKSKAKNWRYTQLEFSTKNIYEGELLLQVKETTTGINLTEMNIPMIKNHGIADTTTTHFQLVLEHEKRKKKNGEYVVEIYHVSQNDSMLVGKTTLLKDGEIHF